MLLTALHGVVAWLTARDEETSPWPAYGDARHKLLQVVGVALIIFIVAQNPRRQMTPVDAPLAEPRV